MTTLILVTGGARSGKSTYAERLAREAAKRHPVPRPAAYIATGMAIDSEFEERIAHHKARRGGDFVSHEEPYAIDTVVDRAFKAHDVVLLECMTTWLGNMFFRPSSDDAVNTAVNALIRAAGKSPSVPSDPIAMLNAPVLSAQPVTMLAEASGRVLIIVSNELGLGIVPADAESRRYRDMHGRMNQMIAAAADIAVFVASGIPVRLK